MGQQIMKKRNFLKTLAALFLVPFAPKKAKSFTGDALDHIKLSPFDMGAQAQLQYDISAGRLDDVYSFVGLLTTKDGRPIFVDNVSNGGYSNNGWLNASFLTSLRRDLTRMNLGEKELKRMDDICEACSLFKPYIYTG